MRFMLVIYSTLGLETQQVDYVNAFCQASLDKAVFVELSSGFETSNKVLL